MKRISLLILGVAVVGLVVAGISMNASANKYKKMKYTPPETSAQTMSAERATSMSDCMSFTASFKSRGAKKDKANFKKQYGAPTSSKGRVCTYNYDNYTNIILDCSKGRCYSRCMYKMD